MWKMKEKGGAGMILVPDLWYGRRCQWKILVPGILAAKTPGDFWCVKKIQTWWTVQCFIYLVCLHTHIHRQTDTHTHTHTQIYLLY